MSVSVIDSDIARQTVIRASSQLIQQADAVIRPATAKGHHRMEITSKMLHERHIKIKR